MTLARQIAERIVAMRVDNISRAAIELSKVAVMDTLGVALAGVAEAAIVAELLKFAESVPGFLRSKLRAAADRSLGSKLLAAVSRSFLSSVFKEMDYQEYGGVPLLGVNGVSIIGHGGSTARAVKNMIFKAEEMVRRDVNGKIAAALGRAEG